MGFFCIVETGTTLHPIGYFTFDTCHRTNKKASFTLRGNRHEIPQFPNTLFKKKSRQKNVSFRKIQLFYFYIFFRRSNLKKSPFLTIEESSKYAWRIKIWKTHKINR